MFGRYSDSFASMDSYYCNSSSYYNFNQCSYFPQTSINSTAENFNYTFNASRSDVVSSPYQFAYNAYTNQNTSPLVYNENDSAYYSSSDYSNYSLNGTIYNSTVFSGNSPNVYTEQTNKKRARQENLQENETQNSAEQCKKRAKVIKLGESDLNIQKLSTGRGDAHYICPICSSSFDSKAKLLMHEHKYHNGGSSKQCPICRKY
jgi:hypothetical protein